MEPKQLTLKTDSRNVLAGLDAGGTTFKCGLAMADGKLITQERFPVSTPAETIASCVEFFRTRANAAGQTISALGIASFGPIDIDGSSPDYGTIMNTPKPGWSNTNLRRAFADALKVPVTVDTDVNGALAAELAWGAAKGVSSAAYVTVGTGIGAGVFSEGTFAAAPLHPEFGHISMKRHADDAAFAGTCSFHGDCLEGLASAAAFMARFGDPRYLDENHPGWAVEADYLAQACLSLSLSFRPQRIILGGGLMLAPHLIQMTRDAYQKKMAGYLGETEAEIEQKIVTPGLGDDAGLLGGIKLAIDLN